MLLCMATLSTSPSYYLIAPPRYYQFRTLALSIGAEIPGQTNRSVKTPLTLKTLKSWNGLSKLSNQNLK